MYIRGDGKGLLIRMTATSEIAYETLKPSKEKSEPMSPLMPPRPIRFGNCQRDQ